MPIPSRIQFYKAGSKPVGDDPDVPSAWRRERPEGGHYVQALMNWRGQSDLSKKEDSDG
jgi:hypothetical protein